ncbi:hypothetical protein [Sphingomonas jaspsi]|uniref:hypothetical protein n=1 Tax=Sphingomonas jaspsi TaxID=392409 RepID=UPI0004BCA65D|nr:hypothetical protein [Sphingomonas jaspsi]
MAVNVTRDFESDEIVIRIKRGGAAGVFARFLDTAADALEHGKIAPTNPNPRAGASLAKAADEIRKITTKIHGHNA